MLPPSKKGGVTVGNQSLQGQKDRIEVGAWSGLQGLDGSGIRGATQKGAMPSPATSATEEMGRCHLETCWVCRNPGVSKGRAVGCR